MGCAGGALRHNAFVYGSAAEYVERTVALLREGLDGGEAALVANSRDRIAMLREALGADASRVTFLDLAEVYTRAAWAISTYHRALVDKLREAPRVRALGEIQVGPSDADWSRWMPYEAASNEAYNHLPAWVICTYDASTLSDAVLEGIERTHPEVLGSYAGGGGSFGDPRELLRRVAPRPAAELPLTDLGAVENLERLRERVAGAAVRAGVPEPRALELILAATELGANALAHGDGIRTIRAGRVDGRFVCEVVDAGAGFDDPFAGYLVPRAGIGTGLWTVRQLVWELELFRAPRGFTARLWV